MGAFLVSAERRGGKVTSLTVRSERGGELQIVSPLTGELIRRSTKPGQLIKII